MDAKISDRFKQAVDACCAGQVCRCCDSLFELRDGNRVFPIPSTWGYGIGAAVPAAVPMHEAYVSVPCLNGAGAKTSVRIGGYQITHYPKQGSSQTVKEFVLMSLLCHVTDWKGNT
jgi:hypothetical protein